MTMHDDPQNGGAGSKATQQEIWMGVAVVVLAVIAFLLLVP
jgi:hypothetical protein